MAAVTPNVLELVARKSECPFHCLICHPPIAGIDIEIAFAVLQKDTDGFWFKPANKRGVNFTDAHTDISADRAKNTAEFMGALPGSGKGGNRPARSAADGA